MATINNKEEPSTAPKPDRWYDLKLGSSFKEHHPSSNFCTLRYEFKPASIDKNQTGTLNRNKDNRVSVEFHNNQHGKPKVTFEGSSEDYKENDAVLFFDGETFRLERLHRAVKRLRHVRTRGNSSSAPAAPSIGTTAAAAAAAAAAETSSPPIGNPNKFQSTNRGTNLPVPVEVERIEFGDFKSLDTKPRNEKSVGSPAPNSNPQNTSNLKMDDLDEQLDILNDDDDDVAEVADRGNIDDKAYHTGIDINIPQQNDTDDEIAEVDVYDDVYKGPNAAEELRAQVNAEGRAQQTSSSSSSESESSGSGSKSSSRSGSGSSSSDSDSSDGDTVNSI